MTVQTGESPSSVIIKAMKNSRLLIFVFVLMTVALCLSYSGQVHAAQAIHHELELQLLPAQGTLQGTQRITLPADGPSARFFLAPQVEVHRVALDGVPLRVSFARGILDVRLPHGLRDGQVTLEISYSGHFSDPVPQAPITNEDPTYGVAATISERGTFLAGGSGWYADPRSGNATWSIKISAPSGYLAVTAGRLNEQTTTADRSLSHWIVETPLPHLTLSAGPYLVEQTDVEGITLMTYFYEQSQDLVPTYLNAARGYLELYQELFGAYPFEKFAIVENFFPTGYGFPSWTLLGSTVIRLPFIVETSLGHEIAHSWWGTGVRVDFREGNWSEGLATYVADYLFLERQSAEAARDYRLKILRDYASLVTPDQEFPLNRFLRRDSRPSQAIGYGKAAMVFHMVRQQIGEEAFWQGLRHIAETRMFQQVTWSDFSRTFSRLADTDLQPFFNQWLQRDGAPLLSLDNIQARQNGNEWVVSGRIVQQRRPFALHVPLVLETQESPIQSIVQVNGRETPFQITTSMPPRRLLVDPNAHVFRRLFPEEIPASVNNIRGSQSLLAVISNDITPDTAEASLLLLRALRQEGIRVIEETDFSPDRHEGRDVLFIGLPENYADPLYRTTSLSLSADRLKFKDQTYSGDHTALFAAVPSPADSEATWAYFIPLSAAAAQDAARRIPHYGRYSYLVFHQGANQDKGIWEIQDSPLIHNFNK